MLFMREEINAMDKNIFIILSFKKHEVEGRDTQHISLCALNKVQYAWGSKALDAHSQR